MFNVFWFQVSDLIGSISTPVDMQQATYDAYNTLIQPMAQVQSTQLVYQNAVLENMTNLVDQTTYVHPTPLGGALVQPSEPSAFALSFKLIRTSRLTRNGSKRVGGVAESVVEDTTGLAFSLSTACTAIEDAFSSPVVVVVGAGQSCNLNPVIVRRPANGLPVTVFQPVAACQFRGAGTQNTRKRLL
jgi:acyl-homoserine lactone acylase PvdQ